MITLGQIYRTLTGLGTTVARIENVVADVRQAQHDLREDHEARLRALESVRMPWKAIAGWISMAGVVLAALAMLAKNQ